MAISMAGAPIPPPVDNLDSEQIDMEALAGTLAKEVLNNAEEQSIISGPNSDYFTGFNDGMNEAIGAIISFDYTGNEPDDFAEIAANLLLEEAAAESAGTLYGNGAATAYQDALVILNAKINHSINDPVIVVKTEAGPQDAPPAVPAVPTAHAPVTRAFAPRTAPLR
jgi:hypothetical protein